jgi:hypothetical protein
VSGDLGNDRIPVSGFDDDLDDPLAVASGAPA